MEEKKAHRDERFEWQAGDVKITFSQCATCSYNEGPQKCEVYGGKPGVYAVNIEECPSKLEVEPWRG